MALGKALKSLASKLGSSALPPTRWQPAQPPYPMLQSLDPKSFGVTPAPGLVAIWHLGVRPQWLKIAPVLNLEVTLTAAAQHGPFLSYRPNGGVYVSWASAPPTSLSAYATFLIQRLKPALQDEILPTELKRPADVTALEFPFPPGTET